MTFAEAWDRGFWSLMIFVFLCLVWLGLLDDSIPIDVGFVLPALVGGAYFWIGWRKTSSERAVEERAIRDLEMVED